MTDLLAGTAGPLGWAVILATFLVAGFVKGVIGLGLPTVAVGLLATVMSPAQAAALLIVPSFVTNVWQLLAGPRFGALLRRLWPMMVAIAVGTVASAGLIAGAKGPGPASALGAALVVYAVIGLAGFAFRVPARAEPWLSPVIGLATGLVTGATGVFVIPAVPYLQALGLDRDQLIQALGLSFTVSTVALAAGLAREGALPLTAGAASLVTLAPALLGMAAGQWLRGHVSAPTFRRAFLIGLLLLGAHLASRPWL
ncbi:sulfite exporter TauE/SafE family protein [Methylobacterium sp. SyP6R]|uniref:sulfite exporter TauE/SafE family protein n=1 Tax=Methylobacterium sp. SyP6R TaxID=2718876 RepID=UPI001F2083C8|nr:sulfite exporter TauE/SafE family protein [Methylobacterium sp. SyP6R]MCF4126237.1 sulfite exporter TauE/SafE family protein [Methylobacterium sp. SyP6R]